MDVSVSFLPFYLVKGFRSEIKNMNKKHSVAQKTTQPTNLTEQKIKQDMWFNKYAAIKFFLLGIISLSFVSIPNSGGEFFAPRLAEFK